ncbi:MAG: GHKL domain-containing protein [Defluviitaleaceae bacterium]|nr:GHKL domain-containing protein [Defluviitaleaceae bacterium]
MPLALFLLVEFIIRYIIFANILKKGIRVFEMLGLSAFMTMVIIAIFSTEISFEATAIISNIMFTAMLAVFAFFRTKKIPISLVFSILTTVIALLSGYLASSIFTLLHFVFPDFMELGRDGVTGDFVMSAMYLALIFAIAFPISRKLGNWTHSQIHMLNDELQKKLTLQILSGAFITLGVFFVMVFLRYVLADVLTLVYGLSLAIVFMYLVFSIFAFTSSLRKEIELRHKIEMLNNLEAYTKDVEEMASEMRSFRHDHINLMLGFRTHIENNDMESLSRYYEKYMGEFIANAESLKNTHDRLGNMQVPELKSLLFAKFVQAGSAGIETHLEVPEKITIVGSYNLLDTCRAVGILMDNAVEACKGVSGASIGFMATMTNEGVYLVFQNTCEKPPPLNKITEKGFSTKGNARGLGLYNLSQLVAKNSNLTLNTSIKAGYFVQELKIASSEEGYYD